MDFSDQVPKSFLNNAFNNEMHKIFIGFFIPATYTAYCTVLHGMSNQLKALRSKDWTMTTVTRVTRNFIMVNSTTDDIMDWEPTVTNSSTKMVRQKAKWVFPAIIMERKKKGACFRCGIVGHRVNNFFFTWPTTGGRRRRHSDGDFIHDDDDDDSENDHRKKRFGKK